MGLEAGFRLRREERREVPALVRRGKRARMMEPVVLGVGGRRRERALGRRLKVGQVEAVGMPQSSKIWG